MSKNETKTSRSDPDDDDLVRRAHAARALAYSPYSKIQVGAALRSKDGRVFTGCNVENASYGLTLCAERAAVMKAVSEGAREFTSIAITTSLGHALMPCGACRQVLSEFAPALRVLVEGATGTRALARLDELLPQAFRPSDLA